VLAQRLALDPSAPLPPMADEA